ncbi:hypothetical protein [Tenggerimyces flavus]|uniref:NIPSNAP domain-containing protein n=1 Tax=Tenggerimyces flavus TaxID=1708749 RepID=A0ABV7YJ10_9ACTN|nr:hypothetical protein [Tenggerimyces flavus]MBM7787612.1 hypothetical protein [Tenggerimyces flavus]
MFVQVIQARTKQVDAVEAMMGRWSDELQAGSIGWLGTTAGITEDGTAISVVRFDSAESARANSDRPEQGAWWNEFAKLLDGEATFHDCTDVHTLGAGGSDQAGFVQIIQGRISDRSQLTDAWSDLEKLLAVERPELLGTMLAFHDDGSGFTEVAYFTTEAEARAGEANEPSEDAKRMWERERALYTDLSYFDIREPWLPSPG